MMKRASLGLLCGALSASVAEGGFAQPATQWAMRGFQAAETTVEVQGRQILVNGEPLHIKGVCWNPIAQGGSHPDDLDRDGFVERDADLMVEAGINAVRMYEPLLNRTTLDTLYRKGIHVINMAYPWGGTPLSEIPAIINAVKDHPAIIMWEVGNEWNYNRFYYGPWEENGNLDTLDAAVQLAVDVVDVIKQHDQVHPVSSVFGELADLRNETLNILGRLSAVDVWAINVYRSADFGNLFSSWAELSEKPMYLGEYGADAWDANNNNSNVSAQAYATRVLTEQINTNAAVTGGVCSGGLVFELADEWWKAGDPDVHDIGGQAPGGGPYPDLAFNEEWWGLCDIDRNCRPAFYEYKNLAIPRAPAAPAPMWPLWAAVIGGVIAVGLAAWCCLNNSKQGAEEPLTEMS